MFGRQRNRQSKRSAPLLPTGSQQVTLSPEQLSQIGRSVTESFRMLVAGLDEMMLESEGHEAVRARLGFQYLALSPGFQLHWDAVRHALDELVIEINADNPDEVLLEKLQDVLKVHGRMHSFLENVRAW